MTVTDLHEVEDEAARFDREDMDEARAALDAEMTVVENGDGTFQLLVGGKQPTTTKVRLLGGGIEVDPPEGGFLKGASYVLRVEAYCSEAVFKDEIDGKTHQVVGCTNERKLKIRGVAVVG